MTESANAIAPRIARARERVTRAMTSPTSRMLMPNSAAFSALAASTRPAPIDPSAPSTIGNSGGYWVSGKSPWNDTARPGGYGLNMRLNGVERPRPLARLCAVPRYTTESGATPGVVRVK